MVSLKGINYNLNHNYHIYVANAVVSVGADNSVAEYEIELFPKTLPLAEDMDRIPILRRIDAIPALSYKMIQNTNSAGQYGAEFNLQIWNGEVKEIAVGNLEGSMDFLCSAQVLYNEDDATPEQFALLLAEQIHRLFQGGIVLKNKITLKIVVNIPSAASGSALPYNMVNWHCFFEVDWTPVSKSEFDSYIRESIFSSD